MLRVDSVVYLSPTPCWS